MLIKSTHSHHIDKLINEPCWLPIEQLWRPYNLKVFFIDKEKRLKFQKIVQVMLCLLTFFSYYDDERMDRFIIWWRAINSTKSLIHSTYASHPNAHPAMVLKYFTRSILQRKKSQFMWQWKCEKKYNRKRRWIIKSSSSHYHVQTEKHFQVFVSRALEYAEVLVEGKIMRRSTIKIQLIWVNNGTKLFTVHIMMLYLRMKFCVIIYILFKYKA